MNWIKVNYYKNAPLNEMLWAVGVYIRIETDQESSYEVNGEFKNWDQFVHKKGGGGEKKKIK